MGISELSRAIDSMPALEQMLLSQQGELLDIIPACELVQKCAQKMVRIEFEGNVKVAAWLKGDDKSTITVLNPISFMDIAAIACFLHQTRLIETKRHQWTNEFQWFQTAIARAGAPVPIVQTWNMQGGKHTATVRFTFLKQHKHVGHSRFIFI